MPKLAVGQFNSYTGCKEKNLEKIEWLTQEATSNGANLIVLPELSISGYRVDEKFIEIAETLNNGESIKELSRISSENNGIWIYTTIPELNTTEEKPYNTAIMVNSEGLVAYYRKVHLWGNEFNYFSAGNKTMVVDTPIGKVGMLVCFDISFPEISRTVALQSCEVLLYSMAFSPDSRKYALDLFSRTRALENGCYVGVSNHVGREKDTDFFGGSQIVNPDGKVLDKIDQDEGIIICEIDNEFLLDTRKRYPYLNKRSPDAYRL
ncbi:MAG: carbon-nitrogen hydrolase family protein [Bacillota bacterium]|nr:carbon-nitrogen hydrolase family protein [Bacillota bacterium]